MEKVPVSLILVSVSRWARRSKSLCEVSYEEKKMLWYAHQVMCVFDEGKDIKDVEISPYVIDCKATSFQMADWDLWPHVLLWKKRCLFEKLGNWRYFLCCWEIFRWITKSGSMILIPWQWVICCTARKTVFPRLWNITESSKRSSKYYLYINFLSFLRPYFPSPKGSKQELFGSPKQEHFSNQ